MNIEFDFVKTCHKPFHWVMDYLHLKSNGSKGFFFLAFVKASSCHNEWSKHLQKDVSKVKILSLVVYVDCAYQWLVTTLFFNGKILLDFHLKKGAPTLKLETWPFFGQNCQKVRSNTNCFTSTLYVTPKHIAMCGKLAQNHDML
jgi:hypothetical protein